MLVSLSLDLYVLLNHIDFIIDTKFPFEPQLRF